MAAPAAGCGLCPRSRKCPRAAIALIGGKAYLAREHYCDGLGDCLPGCPTGAITFETREAPAYDEAAVLKAIREGKTNVDLNLPINPDGGDDGNGGGTEGGGTNGGGGGICIKGPFVPAYLSSRLVRAISVSVAPIPLFDPAVAG